MILDESTVVVRPIESTSDSDTSWQPTIGKEARGVVSRKQLPDGSDEDVIESAQNILARGIPPMTHDASRTGLVVGYVQSGKTLSFTTVIALARDNGYQLIITIAGTSTALFKQSSSRLRDDLFIDDLDGYFRWSMFENPDPRRDTRPIQQTLDEWRDPLVQSNEKPTVLITVMKNHKHLGNLVTLLNKLNIEKVPTLIIDDEADQASLNTLVKKGKESTTYNRLIELRDSVSGHTFLQYTATPQAPLLINIIDSLSPDFVQVLEPGKNYVGGKTFFEDSSGIARIIPIEDVPSDSNTFGEPPLSLITALRVFFVGVSIGLIQGRTRSKANRSMLVHPSREVAQHYEYKIWIDSVVDEWARLISLSETNTDRLDFIEDFKEAYNDISKTETEIPSFENVQQMLPRAFRVTRVVEVNTREGQKTPSIQWNRAYGWILVGGQAMDRGFTVEGLTVTYMPRGPGIGNADTIQQRGRFFGYKGAYIGFCRIYLEQNVLEAFRNYIEHEEMIRAELQIIQRKNTPLSEWKRVFVLHSDLRPCRHNVIECDYSQGSYADKWFVQSYVLSPPNVIDANRKTTRDFFGKLPLVSDSGHTNRKPAQIHKQCKSVRLVDVIESLLVPYRLTDHYDSQEFMGVLMQLSNALDVNSAEICTVYEMSPGYIRKRKVSGNGKIRYLFQGPAPVKPIHLQGSVYPGDSALHDENKVTVQIHYLVLTKEGKEVANGVPVLAVWIPGRMKLDWVSQEQQ